MQWGGTKAQHNCHEFPPFFSSQAAFNFDSSSNSSRRNPTTNQWYAKWEAQLEYVQNTLHTHTRFCTFGADLQGQSPLISKISASELSRKSIKSALLVGKEEVISAESPCLSACVEVSLWLFFLLPVSGFLGPFFLA